MRHGFSVNACRGGRLCPPQTFFFSFAPLAGCFLLAFVGAGFYPARWLSKKPVIASQSADWRGNLFPNRTILRFSANLQLKDCGFPRALRAAKQVPLGCALGMTKEKQNGRSVDGCRGRCPHRPETYDARDFGRQSVGAGFYPARRFTARASIDLPQGVMPTQRSKYPWGASPRMPRRCRGISLPPSKPSVLPPPSQREAGEAAPAGAGLRIPTGALRPRNDRARIRHRYGRRM